MGISCISIPVINNFKMKILLIDPPYERLFGFRSEWFPLGLAYIAAYLAKRGHDVGIYNVEHGSDTEYKSIVRYAKDFNRYKLTLELNSHPIWKEIRETINSFKPKIVGVSVITPKVPSAFRIAEICKSLNPPATVVFGGHHPTIRPDEMLLNKNVDFCLRGEGEDVFNALVEYLQDGESNYKNIPGLIFRDDNRIVDSPNGSPIDDLDSLPLPARDKLFNFNTYTPAQLSMVMTSRGCPYDCGFCASGNMWHRRVRFRSVENIMKEVYELKNKYLVKHIMFMDDAFTLDSERVKALCLALIKSKIGISWSCLTRANMITDELIMLMRKSGCVKIDIGIESGNQRILDLISKGITLEQIREAVKILRKNRMYWSGFFMFGFPSETEREILDTLNFLKELRPDWANMSIFTPYPGTSLHDICLKNGMISEPRDYALFSHQNIHSRYTDKIPSERFHSLARHMFKEVNKRNSSPASLIKRALTRRYYRNPRLFWDDAKKAAAWLKK